MNVLIIEDEKSLSHEMELFLNKEGFNCDSAFTGASARERLKENSYDFVLLDIGLPDADGFEILKEAKDKKIEASFIVLTARGELDDKIKGLELGADDYLPKPFSLLELKARMHAITRTKHGLQNDLVNIGEFVMDVQNRTLTHKEKNIKLTKKEFDLLNYLTLHKNRVLTRMQLTEHIWGDVMQDDFDSNYIDVHIKNVRKKLSAAGDISFLETVRGIGYRMNL